MKKILAALFLLALFIPTKTFAFSDIENNTHKDNILALQSKQIIQGYEDGTFRPNEPVTRGQALQILANMYEQTNINTYNLWRSSKAGYIKRNVDWNMPQDPFTDLPYLENKNDDYYRLMDTANLFKQLNVITGYPDGTLRPSQTLTRSQLAKMLQQLFLFPNTTIQSPFIDTKNNDNAQAITNLYAYGITQGTTLTTFSPNAAVTRGQFASFIVRTQTFIASVEAPSYVKVVKNSRSNEEFSQDSTQLITTENATNYDITTQQLKNYQYVAYSYTSGGCGIQLNEIQLTKNGLSMTLGSPEQVQLGFLACTADIWSATMIFQFDKTINLQKVTLNGKPLLQR